jgi:hypothetical protein
MVPSNRNPSCGTITTRPRSESKGIRSTSTPPIRTVPEVGSIIRVSSFASVVLPLPVSPTIATCVRGGIDTLRPCRTSGPPG